MYVCVRNVYVPCGTLGACVSREWDVVYTSIYMYIFGHTKKIKVLVSRPFTGTVYAYFCIVKLISITQK